MCFDFERLITTFSCSLFEMRNFQLISKPFGCCTQPLIQEQKRSIWFRREHSFVWHAVRKIEQCAHKFWEILTTAIESKNCVQQDNMCAVHRCINQVPLPLSKWPTYCDHKEKPTNNNKITTKKNTHHHYIIIYRNKLIHSFNAAVETLSWNWSQNLMQTKCSVLRWILRLILRRWYYGILKAFPPALKCREAEPPVGTGRLCY